MHSSDTSDRVRLRGGVIENFWSDKEWPWTRMCL